MRTLAMITLVGTAMFVVAGTLKAEDPKPVSKEELAKLIQDLGADDFRARERASKRLTELGAAAKDALREAAKSSPSAEVRWRADQILRRLDGTAPKPLGADPGATELPEEPEPTRPTAPVRPGAEDPFARLRELMKQFGRRGAGSGAFELDSMMPTRRVEVPGLVLERAFMGPVRLTVKSKDEAGVEREKTYTGTSLSDILGRYPELADHAGMDELKRKQAETTLPGFEDILRRRMPSIRFKVSPDGRTVVAGSAQNVEIRHDADGVTVKVTEEDENGEKQVKEYKGESIEQIKREHPELKDKIGGLGNFHIRIGPPQVIWPDRRRRLDPLRPVPPTTVDPAPTKPLNDGPFGAVLGPLDEVLASHLGLGKGEGSLVHEVRPASAADKLGLRRHDVIVKVNGQAVRHDESTLVSTLRSTGKDERAKLDLEIIRRGKATTLSR